MFDIEVMTSPITLDCGPTCLKMLLKYYGIEATQEELNSKCNIDLLGCTAKDLKNVGNEYGLDMKVYEMGMDELFRQDRPAIIWWKHNHFCIFKGLDDEGRIMIINPDKGSFAIPKNVFKNFYTGIAIFNGEPQDLPKEISADEKIDALMRYFNLSGEMKENVFTLSNS